MTALPGLLQQGPCPPPTGAQLGAAPFPAGSQFSCRRPWSRSWGTDPWKPERASWQEGSRTPTKCRSARPAAGRPRADLGRLQGEPRLAPPERGRGGGRRSRGPGPLPGCSLPFPGPAPLPGRTVFKRAAISGRLFSVSLPAGGSAIWVSRHCGSRGGREVAHLSYAGALRPDIEGDGGSCSNLHPRLLRLLSPAARGRVSLNQDGEGAGAQAASFTGGQRSGTHAHCPPCPATCPGRLSVGPSGRTGSPSAARGPWGWPSAAAGPAQPGVAARFGQCPGFPCRVPAGQRP